MVSAEARPGHASPRAASPRSARRAPLPAGLAHDFRAAIALYPGCSAALRDARWANETARAAAIEGVGALLRDALGRRAGNPSQDSG